MSVSGIAGSTTPTPATARATATTGGIGGEFVRPMGVPSSAPSTKSAATDASRSEHDDDDEPSSASASTAAPNQQQPNLFGGRLDLKA